MNTNIKTTNISVTPEISSYIEKRIDKINKLVGNDPSAQCFIELGRTTEHHQKGEIFRAEIHIVAAGKNCYTASEKGDLFSAIDDAREEMLRELRAVKGKKISLIKRSGAKVKNIIKGFWPWGKDRI